MEKEKPTKTAGAKGAPARANAQIAPKVDMFDPFTTGAYSIQYQRKMLFQMALMALSSEVFDLLPQVHKDYFNSYVAEFYSHFCEKERDFIENNLAQQFHVPKLYDEHKAKEVLLGFSKGKELKKFYLAKKLFNDIV